MAKILIGQRYMSEAEPELGLGIISKIEDKTLVVDFPAAQESRRYGLQTAPLKRVSFEEGDEISSNQGHKFIVQEVVETNTGLLAYIGPGADEEVIECDLLDSINFHTPLEKILNAIADSHSLFNLRYHATQLKKWLSTLKVRGLIGGRVSLIDHQLYLVSEIIQRQNPRVLLSDEVGLGKTIEAGMIIHYLLLTNKIERALLVLPNTLCHQWFVEMLVKYNLTFKVVNEQTRLEPDSNPFDESNLVITSLQLLCGSEVANKMIREAKWDLMVVDEAHSLEFELESPSIQYQKVEELAQLIPSLLLLTATPEMYGQLGHFSRLRLLDSNRFHDYDAYLKESEQYHHMAIIARKLRSEQPLTQEENQLLKDMGINSENNETIISELLDRHGTGRVYFRNTRNVMAKVYDFFPKRLLESYPLQLKDEKKFINAPLEGEVELNSNSEMYKVKLTWLSEYLNNNREKKTLLICRSKRTILRLEKDLRETTVGNKTALFHSDLSLIARDRQAAYFHDENGANILLCTEIGSEGRNFEFAHDLILFDLPKNPDLLEQRIGRLDRIGQTQNIRIHVPYLLNSYEEIYFEWYHQAINGFLSTSKGAMKILEQFKAEFDEALADCKAYLSNDHQKLAPFIQKCHKAYVEFSQFLEEGRDTLIEINSFNHKIAKELKKEIRAIDEDPKLRKFLEKVYSHFGVDCEDLDMDSQFIKPSHNMFVPHFPFLPQEGFSYTFSRDKALDREDLVYMSFDHPMVTGIFEMILGQEYGNATVVSRGKGGKPKIFLELFYKIESVAPKNLQLEKFLPPSLIRVLLNPEGTNFSEKWDKEELDGKLIDVDKPTKIKVSKFSKSELKELIHKGLEQAELEAKNILSHSNIKIDEDYNARIDRLKLLKQKNKYIPEEEINSLEETKNELKRHLMRSTPHLDSFRFIY